MDIDQFHALLMKSFGDKINEDPDRVCESLTRAANDMLDLAQKIKNMDKSGYKSVSSIGDRVFVNIVRPDNVSLN